MTTRSPWILLGIEPTSDRRAIRVAYSAALKEIDPEADPKAFIALREAYEAAQADAAWTGEAGAAPEAAVPEIAFEHGGAEVRVAQGADDERWAAAPPEPDAADLHAQAIMSLLYKRHSQRWLTEDDRAAILKHWTALTTDPRMEQIGFFGDIERWAAEVIANGIPFSSPLIVPATRLFGWLNNQGKLAESPAAAEVVRLYWLRGRAEAAQRPGNVLHPAWVELTTPAFPGSGRGRVDPYAVFQLITLIRQSTPETEARLDPARVELWRDNTADPYSRAAGVERASAIRQGAMAKWLILGWIALSFITGLIALAGHQ